MPASVHVVYRTPEWTFSIHVFETTRAEQRKTVDPTTGDVWEGHKGGHQVKGGARDLLLIF